MEITYTKQGGYLLPNLTLKETKKRGKNYQNNLILFLYFNQYGSKSNV